MALRELSVMMCTVAVAVTYSGFERRQKGLHVHEGESCLLEDHNLSWGRYQSHRTTSIVALCIPEGFPKCFNMYAGY